jgi:hypothetical protein
VSSGSAAVVCPPLMMCVFCVTVHSQAQEHQAARMRCRAAALDGGVELPPGAIVRLCLDPVDRAKLDNSSAVCVVIQREKKSYRIANAGGVYKELVSRAHLQYVPQANTSLMGLDDVLHNWRDLPHISVRGIARADSVAGGQGLVHCNCNGDCAAFRCSCFKAQRMCNSRCHPKNTRCCNRED